MDTPTPQIDIVLPVYNEADTLRASTEALHAFMVETFGQTRCWQITIADNASTDGTADLARSLAVQMPNIRPLILPVKGRGRALKAAWLSSTAAVVAYMDIDLSTDLRALPPLVAPLLSGHSDLAIGSRLAHGARVVRCAKREVLSRGYNQILRGTLGIGFTDAQCGFKAMTAEAAHHLLPLVRDDEWFFDTELLVLAERCGLRIAEVPVDWLEDSRTTVDVPRTVGADLRGIARLGWQLGTGALPLAPVCQALGRRPLVANRTLGAQIIGFGVVGIASTIAYSLLFILFQLFCSPQASNLLALAISTILNTMVNRRVTFGVSTRAGALVHLAEGLGFFVLTWLLSSGALAVVMSSSPPPGHLELLVVVTAANLAVTVIKFLIMRVLFHSNAATMPETHETLTREELLRT